MVCLSQTPTTSEPSAICCLHVSLDCSSLASKLASAAWRNERVAQYRTGAHVSVHGWWRLVFFSFYQLKSLVHYHLSLMWFNQHSSSSSSLAPGLGATCRYYCTPIGYKWKQQLSRINRLYRRARLLVNENPTNKSLPICAKHIAMAAWKEAKWRFGRNRYLLFLLLCGSNIQHTHTSLSSSSSSSLVTLKMFFVWSQTTDQSQHFLLFFFIFFFFVPLSNGVIHLPIDNTNNNNNSERERRELIK